MILATNTLLRSERAHDRPRSVKVRLDICTVTTLGNTQTLDFWKQRYPMAIVIDRYRHDRHRYATEPAH